MTKLYQFLDYTYMMQHKRQEKEKLLQSDGMMEKRVAVLCGSTFGEIQDFLELFLLSYGIKPVFLIGEYNRFYEEACFPNEALEKFQPDLILIHVTNKNLLYQYDVHTLEEDRQRFRQIWEALVEKYHCMVIQNNFEYFKYRMIGNAARTHMDGNIKYIDGMNRFLADYLKTNKNFYLNDINFLSSYTGLKNWCDDKIWYLYKYPMAMSEMPRYALNIANIIKSVFGKNKKTIITDLDHTLWGGEIGEIGAENINIGNETPQGEAFAAVQRYLKYLSLKGVVLNICSKNEYEAGISGIHSAKSILKEGDFAVKKINWKNKAENVKEILEELNLVDDSAVFMDDDPLECESMKWMLPQVETLQTAGIRDFLEEIDAVSFFEMVQATREDEERNRYYADNLARKKEQKGYKDYNEYLRALDMACYVYEACDRNMDRVVQLMNKTNQFNFLTKRYTLETMAELVQKKENKTFVLELEDKFGSNGIVSAAIVRFEGRDAFIDGWVMSCRVFERGLEFMMLKLVCEECLARDICVLHGYYRKTDKNAKISRFFPDLGFVKDDAGRQNENIQEWICQNPQELLENCKARNLAMKCIYKQELR